ncbi:sensor histidine kinase [Streptacidiphilus sp. N1-12]|uniref:Sensor histidine kinase n=2 Tax=Streptacidiphilus alkalitolerans TaxID=3342712 RepID=A0ABV6WQX4_9ACTN
MAGRQMLRGGVQWRQCPLAVRDGALAVLLGALAFAPGIAGDGMALGELPVRQLDLLGMVVGLGQCLPLFLRRLRPGVCLAVIGLCFCVGQVRGYAPNFGSEGLLAALYGAGAHLRTRRLVAAALAVAGYAALAAVLRVLGSPERTVDYITFALVLAGCWWAGEWVRARHTAAERQRAFEVQSAAAAERDRIARDLHDVVTHHVTAMVVQADAAQFLLPQAGGRAAESLETISETGRRALAELRFLLGALNGPCDAQTVTRGTATDTRIADLVEQVRRTGQPVEYLEEGEQRATGGGPEVTAYRIVQEALTNALKHAPGQRTAVKVGYTPAEVVLAVTTDGAPSNSAVYVAATRAGTRPAAVEPPRAGAPVARDGGLGLAGLRQRVAVFGGEFSAGPLPGGGFQVVARLPLEAAL